MPNLISDAERTSLTYHSYAFEIHLDPAQQSLSVRAHVMAENTGIQPLQRIALQLSSSLHWESVRIDGQPVKFQSEPVESDIDHTGKLTEAIVQMAAPLAPGATMQMDVIYSGVIQQSSTRLLRLGAPAAVAATSEWDNIGPDFTALRGFGNVIWFPVSTAPVLLGQGSEMFDSVGKWKLRESDALVEMHVLAEYHDQPPNAAVLNGYVVRPNILPTQRGTALHTATGSNTAGDAIPRIVSFDLANTKLGFAPLSFFVLSAQEKQFPGLDVFSRSGNESSAAAYAKIAMNNRALIEQWLGPRPKRTVVLIDLPENNDLPFEDRNVLFLPLQANVSDEAAGPVLAHMLSHAYFISSRPWLDEGVAQWMTLLWIEQRAGRAGAIAQLDSHRAALALTETSDPGIDPGQSLIHAWSDIYYRDKAAYVLWMLRDIVGDAPLASALQKYDPAADREPSYLQSLLQKPSGNDLEWFFDDWVYRDRGLPDLNIVSAYLRSILTKNSAAKNYLVSVNVQNDSFCSTEVPVTVDAVSTVQAKRLIVPAHGRASLRVLLESKPNQVVVNDGSVPEVRTSQHQGPIQPAQ